MPKKKFKVKVGKGGNVTIKSKSLGAKNKRRVTVKVKNEGMSTTPYRGESTTQVGSTTQVRYGSTRRVRSGGGRR